MYTTDYTFLRQPEPGEPEPELGSRRSQMTETPWRPKDDPRLARVLELERSGDAESAARLLRVVLWSLDPEQTKPKLHAHLSKLEQQLGRGGTYGPPECSAPLTRTRSARALAEAAAERERRQAALAITEAERVEHAELDTETRLLRQAITVFNAGAQLADSLQAAGFERFEPPGATPRGRGTHGQWFHTASSIFVEIDPAIPGGLAITVPWSRYHDRLGPGADHYTADDDVAEWLELTLASDPNAAGSFGTRFLRWLDDYTHLNSTMADAESGAPRRTPEAGELEAVDVGLSRLPTAAALGAAEDRELTIYTWGDALSSRAALKQLGSQLDINAKPLNGRGGGANTRYNALQDTRIMRNVVSSMCEGTGALLLKRAVAAIETDSLHTISVFCTKGRHRSVSVAEALRARYYPKAEVKHLTIK